MMHYKLSWRRGMSSLCHVIYNASVGCRPQGTSATRMQWVFSDGMYESWHGTDDRFSRPACCIEKRREGVQSSLFWALSVRLVPRWGTLVVSHW